MSGPVLIALITICASLVCGGLAYAIADYLDPRIKSPHQKVFLWRIARTSIAAPAIVMALSVVFADNLPRLPLSSPETASYSTLADIPLDLSLNAYEPQRAQPREPGGPTVSATSTQNGSRWSWLPSWQQIILGTYYVGLVVFAGRFILRRLALSGVIAGSRPATDRLNSLLEQWIQRLNLERSRVRLRIMEAPLSPFVIGVRPTIFIPSRMADPTSEKTAELALVHELIHVRRRDEWDRLIGEALSPIFWFNPMLGWIEHRLALVREMACDAETLDVLGKECRRAYACALVDAARVGPPFTSKVMAFGSHHKRSKVMRVKAILSGQPLAEKSGGLKAIIVAGFVALMAPAFAAQAIATASITNPNAAALSASSATHSVITVTTPSNLQTLVDSSPLLALEQLESLQSLESLGDVAGESMMSNPANWAAIGAYASGASDSLRLRTEDDDGNPVVINLSGRDGDEAVYIEFIDEEGRSNILDVSSEGNEEMVSLRYEGEEPHFSVTSNEDDEAVINFIDNDGAPIRMEVSEDASDTAQISISDQSTGEASDFRFVDYDDDMVRAPAAGRVTHVGLDEGDDGLGEYIVIDHGTGWSTIFYHMVDVSVAAGDSVEFDQVIGQSTGDDHRGRHNRIDINDTTNMSIVRTRDVNL